MVCADRTFPELPRALVLEGADPLLWPNGRAVVGAEAETTAKANLVPIVVSNLLGNNGTNGGGSSRILGPWGDGVGLGRWGRLLAARRGARRGLGGGGAGHGVHHESEVPLQRTHSPETGTVPGVGSAPSARSMDAVTLAGVPVAAAYPVVSSGRAPAVLRDFLLLLSRPGPGLRIED